MRFAFVVHLNYMCVICLCWCWCTNALDTIFSISNLSGYDNPWTHAIYIFGLNCITKTQWKKSFQFIAEIFENELDCSNFIVLYNQILRAFRVICFIFVSKLFHHISYVFELTADTLHVIGIDTKLFSKSDLFW